MSHSKIHNSKSMNPKIIKFGEINIDSLRNPANQKSHQSDFCTKSYDFYKLIDKPGKSKKWYMAKYSFWTTGLDQIYGPRSYKYVWSFSFLDNQEFK